LIYPFRFTSGQLVRKFGMPKRFTSLKDDRRKAPRLKPPPPVAMPFDALSPGPEPPIPNSFSVRGEMVELFLEE